MHFGSTGDVSIFSIKELKFMLMIETSVGIPKYYGQGRVEVSIIWSNR